MRRYSIEPRTRKYVKGYGFLLVARKYEKKYQIKDQMLPKNQSPGEFIGSEIAQAVTKSNNNKILKQEPFEEIVILQEKRGTIKQIEKSFIKMEHHGISKLLNDSPVSSFVTKKMG